MSGLFASCAGLQIVSGSLVIPKIGAWTADVHLATQQTVSGTVPVVIGNLTLLGTVYRSDVYGGQVRARIVGGYGGWRNRIAPQGYGSGSGVLLSTILNDAASACDERVTIASDRSIGNAYARVSFPSSVAGDILWQMLSQGIIAGWYVAPSGVTITSQWPSINVSTPFTVTDQKPDEGMVEIATEDYASWMPGCTFSSPLLTSGETFTSAGVIYTWDDAGKFRFAVLTGTAQDRVLGPIQAMVQKEISPARFFGRYAYTISNPSSTTVDGTPSDSTLGLPDLQNVPITADSISSYTPPDGGECHIMFLDGVPTKPVCVWTDEAPTLAALLEGAVPVALQGGTVTVLWPGPIPITGVITPPGSAFVGALTITSPGIGQITTGSSRVTAPQ